MFPAFFSMPSHQSPRYEAQGGVTLAGHGEAEGLSARWLASPWHGRGVRHHAHRQQIRACRAAVLSGGQRSAGHHGSAPQRSCAHNAAHDRRTGGRAGRAARLDPCTADRRCCVDSDYGCGCSPSGSGGTRPFVTVLQTMARVLKRTARMNKRRTTPTTAQRLCALPDGPC